MQVTNHAKHVRHNMELQSTQKQRIKEVLDVHRTRFKEELNNGEWKKELC